MSKSWAEKIKGKNAIAALNANVAFAMHAGSIAAVMRKNVDAFDVDDAAHVLAEVRSRVLEARKRAGITKPLPPVQGSRVSEMKGILRLRGWACREALFDHLENLAAPLDIVVHVGKFVRANVDAKTGVCPSRDALLKVINSRKARKNGAAPQRAPNPVTVIDTIDDNVRKLAKHFGKADGHAFITAMLKASQAYKPFALRIKAATEAAKAEARDKK